MAKTRQPLPTTQIDDLEPTFDSDGCPSDKTCELIEHWDFRDLAGLFEFIRKAWSYPEYFKTEGNVITLITGGWSGNESLVSALQQNRVVWAICWEMSERGGKHVFEIPQVTESED